MRTCRPAVTLVTLLAAAGVALVGFGLTAGTPRPPQPDPAHAPGGPRAAPTLPPLPRADPVEVQVPRIGVRAPLVPVTADATGTLEVPPLHQPTVAGWYRPGASPGENGNAVIVGHVDSRAGPAVFFDLGRLRPGDRIRVSRADARVVTFVVDAVGSYPKDRFPTDLVYGPTNGSGLRLVTCGGRFDGATGDYSDNVVVFATRVA
ncbi:Sortase family protein [Micromonospora nigra]|uniref:Sortase family protein n=1 Tax=Micromonospora nigra TaxID=145857 RepID=A0A1C6T4D2_9ACTN|nr:class F sortase [Micromonospora nigra]SCL36680.1 Sortase family protein [Micromonospora nigra]